MVYSSSYSIEVIQVSILCNNPRSVRSVLCREKYLNAAPVPGEPGAEAALDFKCGIDSNY